MFSEDNEYFHGNVRDESKDSIWEDKHSNLENIWNSILQNRDFFTLKFLKNWGYISLLSSLPHCFCECCSTMKLWNVSLFNDNLRLINDGDQFKKKQEIYAHDLKIKLENDPPSETSDLVPCIKMFKKLRKFGKMNTTSCFLNIKTWKVFSWHSHYQMISMFL